MSTDPLSDVLALVDAQSVLSGEIRASGHWAVRFGPRQIKFLAPVRGSCWVSIAGRRRSHRLDEGDVFLLAESRAFVLASDPGVTPIDADKRRWSEDGVMTIGAGREFALVGGHVTLDPSRAWLLLDVLPPTIHVRATSDEGAALRWLLRELVRERAASRPGSLLVSAHAAQMLFVQALRTDPSLSRSRGPGWLRGLGDPAIARALRLMHAEPGRRWELGQLAKAASMSRSSFAVRFKTVLGVTPLTYLTEWRMRLAEKALRDDATSVGTLAESLGYASEAAFSHAFKRVTGSAPTQYRLATKERPSG